MFSLASGIYQSYFAPPKLSIVILGLDGSGKTALLERIKVTEIINSSNTINNDASSATSFLPSMYTKGGAAVAGVDDVGNNDDDGYAKTIQQRRQGGSGGGGRAARLPPPLPPKQALESRRQVEQMLNEGFSTTDHDSAWEVPADGAMRSNANAAAAATTTSRLPLDLERICPPPLVPITEKGGSKSTTSNSQGISSMTNMTQQKLSSKKPAQSTKPLSSSSGRATTTTTTSAPPVQQHNINPTKNTFIGLLRCPSPIKYSNAVIVDDYDNEEVVDEEDPEEPSSWDTEYLRDYYINYHEEEEFDVKHNRVGSNSTGGGGGGIAGSSSGQFKKMFPLDRIRPTLGQNLATLDLRGCKCSLFDLSGAEKMRPLWERYYQDADAIIYVVNAAETSLPKLRQSRSAFERMYEHDVLHRRVRCGLPVLIFANQLDVAYQEYNDSLERANTNGEVQQQQKHYCDGQRGISWNADEEDNFIGGMKGNSITDDSITGDCASVSKRVVDFEGLATLYGFPRPSATVLEGTTNGHSHNERASDRGNIFFFGGSAKSGEGVRAAMEYLVAHARSYHLARNPRR